MPTETPLFRNDTHRKIVHVDMDAFYASVEQRDRPELRGRPIAVGHADGRGVVAAASYEARRFGVHSAMPSARARQLCPELVFVESRMARYREVSGQVHEIFSRYTDLIEPISIDEAFLDLTGMERIYPLPGKAARKLKEDIRKETGLTVSIGVASSRFIAKLASDYRKPDGLTIVPPGREEEFVSRLGLRKLWGIGDSTYQSLRKRGIDSVESLRKYSLEELERLFGSSTGNYLYLTSRGIDPGIYQGAAKSHSISTERTFYPDVYGYEALDTYLLEMAQDVMFRAFREKKIPRSVSLKLRYNDFTTLSVQTTPSKPIYSSSDVYEIARSLLRSKYSGNGVRLIGIALQGIYDGSDVEQPDFFSEKEEKERKLEKTIAAMSLKGSKMVRARNLEREES